MVTETPVAHIADVRTAAQRSLETSSVRKLAEEIGCTRGALHKFVTQGTNPGKKVRPLLMRWYEKAAVGGEIRTHVTTGVDEAASPEPTVDHALNVLTAHLSPGVQRVVKGTVITTLRRMHSSTGLPQPEWLARYRQPDE